VLEPMTLSGVNRIAPASAVAALEHGGPTPIDDRHIKPVVESPSYAVNLLECPSGAGVSGRA
jgi:hypothetical protein